MSSNPPNLIGKTIEGRYLVESSIGAGGMGAIFLARDLKVLGRTVVVKVLLQEAFENEYVVKKFRQEAEALSRLDHPNIVQILDYGEMENMQPYLVLQFIDGSILRSALKQGGIDLNRAATLIRQVAYALTAAHEKGILHRDLKPENVMLQVRDGEERAVVIDFGIAQLQNSVIAPKTIVTATAGTIAYMSPEQLSAGSLTTASDTYALGIIAYELVTGSKPFNPKSPFQLLELQRNGPTVRPSVLRPELPLAAEQAILRALAFEPGGRYLTSRDFGTDFWHAITGGTGVQQRGPAVTLNQPLGRHEASTLAGAAPTGAVVGQTAPTQLNNPQLLTGAAGAVPQTSAEVGTAPKRSRGIMFAAIGLILLVLVVGGGIAAWKLLPLNGPRGVQPPPKNTVPTPTPVAGPPESASLSYSLTVQKVRDGKDYEQPFQSTGREIFENGWKFRLNVSTPGPGNLYLVNEGLDEKSSLLYTMLFPINGDAQVGGKQTLQIPPAPNTYSFTGKTGTEKNWLIWSSKPIPELEAIKGLMNAKDQGEVHDTVKVEALRAFFAAHPDSGVKVDTDKEKLITTLKEDGNLLVYKAELDHH